MNLQFTRLMIGDIYLEKDINNQPRMVLKDELGNEWSVSSETGSNGYMQVIVPKEKCWFFDEKNRYKKATPF